MVRVNLATRASEIVAPAGVLVRFKDPALAWPATAAKVGDRLIVFNTQFNTRNENKQTLPFTLLSVPVARLSK